MLEHPGGESADGVFCVWRARQTLDAVATKLNRFVTDDLDAVAMAHHSYLQRKAECDAARAAFLGLPRWVADSERQVHKEDLEDAKHTLDAARARRDALPPTPPQNTHPRTPAPWLYTLSPPDSLPLYTSDAKWCPGSPRDPGVLSPCFHSNSASGCAMASLCIYVDAPPAPGVCLGIIILAPPALGIVVRGVVRSDEFRHPAPP